MDAVAAMPTQEMTKYVAQLSATHNAFVNESAKTGPRLMDSSPLAESYMELLGGHTLDKGSLAEMRRWSEGMNTTRFMVKETGLSMLPTNVARHGLSVESVMADGVAIITLAAAAATLGSSLAVTEGAALSAKAVQMARIARVAQTTEAVTGLGSAAYG
jgi:hypothetical protein